MAEADLLEADLVLRLAFGTRLRLPDPMKFRGDARMLQPRFKTDPQTAFVAECEGHIVGSVIGMDWGRVFVLGPLSVAPSFAGRGIARLLMRQSMARADAQGFDLAALFTVPDSPTHIRLYESFGYVPNTLTPVMTKEVGSSDRPPSAFSLYSGLSHDAQSAVVKSCRDVAGSIFPGLDLSREINAISALGLGETLLLQGNGGALAGFALCHMGKGSEAGSGNLFVKFAACRPGDQSSFERLLDACIDLARTKGIPRVTAGCNTAREEAYGLMRARGFRAQMIGVAMHRPNQTGWNIPGMFVLDDWR
jgi:predicted N-acetyltransferase YhbS